MLGFLFFKLEWEKCCLFFDRKGVLVGSPFIGAWGSSRLATFFLSGADASCSNPIFVIDGFIAYAPSIIRGADSGTLNGTI